MTTYYVGPGGSNVAAGTSYATRWLTIAKALGAAGIASGDTLYVTPGTYREVVTVAMTSATATTSIIGDTDGSHTSGVPGEVVMSAFTTSDITTPGSTLLSLAGRDFLSFSNITFVAGQNQVVNATTVTSTNITFTDCWFYVDWATDLGVPITVGAGVNAAWLFDRCTFVGPARNVSFGFIDIALNRHTADYDCGIVAQNCLFMGGGTHGIRVASTGSGTGFGGGVTANACTFFGGLTAFATVDANLSTTIPCLVRNSWIWAGTGLVATTSGQIVESYNAFSCNTQRTNVTTGTGSITAPVAPRLQLGQERLWGGTPRPWFTPSAGSALSGWGVGASPPSVDLLNRDRPAGGASTSIAAGAFERHDFGAKETTTTDAGGVALKLTGPGDHDLLIPVDATSTTISVKVYYDTNHATTNKPQAQLLANGELGYAGQTVTATAGTATWDTLTFSAFTPSGKGVVTLRLRSRSAAGNGYAIFDTISIT